jgi:hypothetical protein
MHKIAIDIRQSDNFPFWPSCATRVEVYGSKGLMYIGVHGGGWQVFGEAKQQSRPYELIAQGYGRPGDVVHQDDFIDAIKTRRKPKADAEIGHRSATLVHLCNIAHRVGNEKLSFDPKTERFIGNEAANKLVRRHDRKAWAVPERV